MKLENKIAVITGGAMGNGLGITKVFLKEGAKVAILDYSEKIDSTVTSLNSNNILAYKVDIRNKEKIEKAIKDIFQKWGHIDILVNNAGVCKLKPFSEMDDELRGSYVKKAVYNQNNNLIAPIEIVNILND